MRYGRFLLTASFILLFAHYCLSQAMLKTDFADHGFSVFTSDEPTYEFEIHKFAFVNGSVEDQLRPFSVVVKNTSKRGVVAFGIRWTKRHLETGHVATDDALYIQPFGLLDGGASRHDGLIEGVIGQGASRLVSPVGIIRTAGEIQQLQHQIPTLNQWAYEKVELDSVVFADGLAFGRDQLGIAEKLQARVDARQDLMEELEEKSLQGQSLDSVLQETQSTTAMKKQAPGSKPDVYMSVRQQYLDELTTTAKNFGEEAARKRIEQLKYRVRPKVRQVVNGGH